MKSLEGILKEELIRLKGLEKSYYRQLSKLPKGSIQKKNIRGIDYAYLAYREKKHLICNYLGRFEDEKIKKLNIRIQLRRQYVKLLRDVIFNQQKIMRMLNVKRQPIRLAA